LKITTRTNLQIEAGNAVKTLRHKYRRSNFKFSTYPRRMGNIFEKTKNTARNTI